MTQLEKRSQFGIECTMRTDITPRLQCLAWMPSFSDEAQSIKIAADHLEGKLNTFATFTYSRCADCHVSLMSLIL